MQEPQVNEEVKSTGFTNNISPMTVAEAFIEESYEYQQLLASGNDHKSSIKLCLHKLGMDASDVSRHTGIVRLNSNKLVGYHGAVFVGNTRPSFEYKYLYDGIDILSPENIPEGKEAIDLTKLGDQDPDVNLTIEEIIALQKEDKEATKERNIKMAKFEPWDVSKFIGKNT